MKWFLNRSISAQCFTWQRRHQNAPRAAAGSPTGRRCWAHVRWTWGSSPTGIDWWLSLMPLFYLPLVFPEDFRTIGPIVPSLIYSDFLLVGIPFRHFWMRKIMMNRWSDEAQEFWGPFVQMVGSNKRLRLQFSIPKAKRSSTKGEVTSLRSPFHSNYMIIGR